MIKLKTTTIQEAVTFAIEGKKFKTSIKNFNNTQLKIAEAKELNP
jgi:hypothetical protein